jgi:hypothetical protein
MRNPKFRKTYGAVLLDRVFTCLRQEAVSGETKPEFPFDYVRIGGPSKKEKEQRQEKPSAKSPKKERKIESAPAKKSDTSPQPKVPSQPSVTSLTPPITSQASGNSSNITFIILFDCFFFGFSRLFSLMFSLNNRHSPTTSLIITFYNVHRYLQILILSLFPHFDAQIFVLFFIKELHLQCLQSKLRPLLPYL